jgi:hypothetical protein
MHSQQLQMPLLLVLLVLVVKAADCWHAEEQQQPEVFTAVHMAPGAAE